MMILQCVMICSVNRLRERFRSGSRTATPGRAGTSDRRSVRYAVAN